MKYDWRYNVMFLTVELVQAIVGLMTLTLYRPAWTVAFARWWHQRTYSKVLNNG